LQIIQIGLDEALKLHEEGDREKYDAFKEKFKPKKTTDDCYTPDNIYQTVLSWVRAEYGIDGAEIVRPFYPGEDYQERAYPSECVVVDNPPFSILNEIVDFYTATGVRFFLFAPALTCMNLLGRYLGSVCCICAGAPITYENGADVNTSFVTNLDTSAARSAPDLHDLVEAVNAANLRAAHRELPKYKYPDAVLTAAALNWLSVHGTAFRVGPESAAFVRGLDAQKPAGKNIFGGGLLLSDRAAADRAAADRAAADRAAADRAAAIHWQLSDRERTIIADLK